MVIDNKTEEDVCLLPKKRDIVFPELRTYHDTKRLCKKVGGKMTVVTDDEIQKRLVETFKKTLAEKYYDMGMSLEFGYSFYMRIIVTILEGGECV